MKEAHTTPPMKPTQGQLDAFLAQVQNLDGIKSLHTFLGIEKSQPINLMGTKLQGKDLSGADLSNTNFTGAFLNNTNFTGAKLCGAKLFGANITGAKFTNADCAGANFSRQNFTDTEITGANFTDANLEGVGFDRKTLDGVTLIGANLAGADFTNAGFRKAVLSKDGRAASFSGAKGLNGADFTGVDLAGVGFKGVDLSYTEFNRANLTGANFSGVMAMRISLQGAILSETDFSQAVMHWTDFSGATFNGTKFKGTHLFGSDGLPEETLAQAKTDGAFTSMHDVLPALKAGTMTREAGYEALKTIEKLRERHPGDNPIEQCAITMEAELVTPYLPQIPKKNLELLQNRTALGFIAKCHPTGMAEPPLNYDIGRSFASRLDKETLVTLAGVSRSILDEKGGQKRQLNPEVFENYKHYETYAELPPAGKRALQLSFVEQIRQEEELAVQRQQQEPAI